MRRRSLVALLVVVMLALAPVGPGVAQSEYVRGQPNLSVSVPEPELSPATDTQLTLQVTNNGRLREGKSSERDQVTTARGVTVDVTSDGPFDVSTERRAIGSVPDGAVRDVPLNLTVPEDVTPGTYSIRLRLEYSYTSTSAPGTDVHDRTRIVRTTVDVVVREGARFSLETVDSDAQVGETGPVRVAVTNVGRERARDVTLTLRSTSTDVLLGDGLENTARIDALAPDETTTVTFDASVRPHVPIRNVTLRGDVRFTDPDGIADTQTGLSIGLRPNREQQFTVTVTDSTLRVGELGTIRGRITNDGPDSAEDVVLSLGEAQFEPRSRTYAIGDLPPGESASFRFRGVVPNQTDPVPQRLEVTTNYRTAAGTDRSTVAPVQVAVGDRRDAIGSRPIDATFAAGESGTLEVAITNRRDGPITAVRVTLAVEPPLESDFRTTVVPHLDPGETARVAFDLEVDGDAPPTRYPATIEVEYRDPDDESATARQSTIAVDVTDTGSALPTTELAVTIVVLVLVGVGGWWFYGRRFV